MVGDATLEVGRRIRELRERRGMTHREFRAKTGADAHSIERGEFSPTVDKLQRVADALDVPICSFFPDKL